jgi:HEAT repeats
MEVLDLVFKFLSSQEFRSRVVDLVRTPLNTRHWRHPETVEEVDLTLLKTAWTEFNLGELPSGVTWSDLAAYFVRINCLPFKSMAEKDQEALLAAIDTISQDVTKRPSLLASLKKLVDSDELGELPIKAIARSWHADPTTLPWLLEHFAKDSATASVVLQEAARGWMNDPTVHRMLTDLVTCCFSEDDSYLASQSMEILSRYYKQHPTTMRLLHHLINEQDDGVIDSDLRGRAAQTLGEYFPEDPGTLPSLILCLGKGCGDVSERLIAQHWPDHPFVSDFIKFGEVRLGDDYQPPEGGIVLRNDSIRRWLAENIECELRLAEVNKNIADGPGDPSVRAALMKYAKVDSNRAVRERAIDGLIEVFSDDSAVKSVIIDLASNDEDDCVRLRAITAAGRAWRGQNDELRLLLMQIAESREPWSLRTRALLAIARRSSSNDIAFRELLLRCLQPAEDIRVKSIAARFVVHFWPNNASVREAILNSASEDSDFREFMEPLRLITKDEQASFELIEDRIRREDDRLKRINAMRDFVDSWESHPSMKAFLHNMAKNDPDERIREAAIQELARRHHDDEKTVATLKYSAMSDPSHDVRCGAFIGMALIRNQDDHVVDQVIEGVSRFPEESRLLLNTMEQTKDRRYFAPLLGFARNGSSDIRIQSIRILARQWSAEPDTKALLEYLAKNDQDDRIRVEALYVFVRGYSDSPEAEDLLRDLIRNENSNFVRRAASVLLARRSAIKWVF